MADTWYQTAQEYAQTLYDTTINALPTSASALLSVAGIGATTAVYDSIPDSARETPVTGQQAAAVAAFWATLASRRADYEGLKDTSAHLARTAQTYLEEAAGEPSFIELFPPAIHMDVLVAKISGFNPPAPGPFQYIDSAIETIEASQLPAYDKMMIGDELSDIRSRMALKYWATVTAYTFAGLATGYFAHQAIRRIRS